MVPMLIGGSLNSLGYGLATLGPALGVAWIFASVINAMMSTAFIGFAVVEALALFGFVLAFIVK